MIRYNKTIQTAVAIVSYLAEHYNGEQAKASSRDIAEGRHLSQPLVAKLLTQLSQKKLLSSTPGPNGGYWLSRLPADINLYDVACCFEDPDVLPLCPFGPGWCGKEKPCPLHQDFIDMSEQFIEFLKNTTFQRFFQDTPDGTADAGKVNNHVGV